MKGRVRLQSLILVAVSAAGAALLISFTGDLPHLWPLAGIPILVAAVDWGVPGALVVSSLVAAGFWLALLGEDATVRMSQAPGLPAGLAAFTVGAVFVGISIRRQQLRIAEAEEAAVLDELTGVYEEGHFRARLDEEIRRAQRYGHEVGLVLLDIDDLGGFNDTFGHYKGDLLIKHMAEIARLSVRDSDVLARLDGGCFAVLLVHAGPNESALVAERLRTAVERADFEGDELEPATKRTVSGGVVSYPTAGADVDGLLDRAREALRGAKAEGRNRVLAPDGGPAEREASQAEAR